MATVPPFGELIAAATTSAVHLEARDAYTPSDPLYRDWVSGRPIPEPALPEWRDLGRAPLARGGKVPRPRGVSSTVSQSNSYLTTPPHFTPPPTSRDLPS